MENFIWTDFCFAIFFCSAVCDKAQTLLEIVGMGGKMFIYCYSICVCNVLANNDLIVSYLQECSEKESITRLIFARRFSQ